mgnify:CR=1 FL=1
MIERWRPTISPAGCGVEPATSGAAEQPGEAEAYRAAYALVRGQQWDAAISAFNQFLQDYPAGRYAPNAHYWLGELYLVTTPPQLESARQSFMLLLTQYPDNNKVPDALYKLQYPARGEVTLAADVAGLLRSFDYASRMSVHTAIERGRLAETELAEAAASRAFRGEMVVLVGGRRRQRPA